MKESILFAGQVYFLAFVVGICIAALIKVMVAVIQRISAKKEAASPAVIEEGKET